MEPPTRRSARILEAKAAAAQAAEKAKNDASESSCSRPRKKAKTSSDPKPQCQSRRKKCLSKLPDMPLDILFEVSHYHYPSVYTL